MSKFFDKYPLPIAGLALGLAAAGNLVQPYGNSYRNLFGTIAVMLLSLLIVKIVRDPVGVGESLQNPVIAGVFPTSTMAIMILSTYLRPYAASYSRIIWSIGFALHICLILWFSRKFVLNFRLKQVFPVWFIVYVGITAASVTGPVFGMIIIPKIVFWFGFLSYLILLPIVIYRVVKIKELPEQTMPTLAIFSAPASLLLVGYMNSFQVKNTIIIYTLMILSFLMYFCVLVMLPSLLRLKFFPSYSSFTFPLIISGIASKKILAFLHDNAHIIVVFRYFLKFQDVVGVSLTIYVLIRYLKFLFFDQGGELC